MLLRKSLELYGNGECGFCYRSGSISKLNTRSCSAARFQYRPSRYASTLDDQRFASSCTNHWVCRRLLVCLAGFGASDQELGCAVGTCMITMMITVTSRSCVSVWSTRSAVGRDSIPWIVLRAFAGMKYHVLCVFMVTGDSPCTIRSQVALPVWLHALAILWPQTEVDRWLIFDLLARRHGHKTL